MSRLVGILVLLVLPASAGVADEERDWREGNARNVRWDHPVVEYARIEPCGPPAEEVGRRLPWMRVTAHLRNPGPASGPFWVVTSLVTGHGTEGPLEPLAAGATFAYEQRVSVSPHIGESLWPSAVQLCLDRGPAQRPPLLDQLKRPRDGLAVGLLVERRTFEEGNRRFGSFVRRMRKSFEDLHALFADAGATTPGSSLPREAIRTRFRIQHVEVYDREEGTRPALFDDHPDVDLVIACDEGGPLAGFWLPQYSIGHNFLFGTDPEGGSPRRGLWSAHGEQALWHELLHFRGVPDSYVFEIPKEALPGRTTEAIPLPDRYRLGIMNHPYQEPRISALAAAVANAKHGVAKVGACEEPDHEHGHMWRWLPKRLQLSVTHGGAPLVGAVVRWYRSRPMEGLGDPRRQGVPEDAKKAGTALVDEMGVIEISGDYLGRSDPRSKRSLWLLVEVEHQGETRFGVLRLLDLNEAWVAGHQALYEHALPWSALRRR